MSAAAAAAPSGVVTFLFTDVEGSTRRWEADADAIRTALTAHDKVLRNAIEAHGGFLFKHTGDGVCAAFSSPRCAVDAAVAAQRALELPVRMGIATGEAELRDRDYFGAVLNRAARVMAAVHGIALAVRAGASGRVYCWAVSAVARAEVASLSSNTGAREVQAEWLQRSAAVPIDSAQRVQDSAQTSATHLDAEIAPVDTSLASELIASGATTQPAEAVIAVLRASRDGASINAAAKASGINYRTAQPIVEAAGMRRHSSLWRSADGWHSHV